MKILNFLGIIFLSLTSLQCTDFDGVDLNNLLFPDELKDSNNLSENYKDIILANGTKPEVYKIDPFNIKEASIKGDSLHLIVTFSGGCAKHNFSLIAYNYFMESFPVQAGILLTHDSNGDNCRALITEELSFSLKPLKKEFIESYGQEGTIIINLLLKTDTNEYLKLNYEFTSLNDKNPNLDEEFNLRVNQKAVFKEEYLHITFLSVPEDSRCPINVNCIWEGNAAVELLINKGNISKTITLHTSLEPKEIYFEGYLIILKQLNPYPADTDPIKEKNYITTLLVKKG